jgi:hypothetical protein
MKVFISWSGERSKKIGEAFRHWLPDVLQFVKPYFTPDDIEKGQRWSTEIALNLEASKFGLICVTAENRLAPWLMFEAGAISKSRSESRVCALLFDLEMSQLSGPLREFQATPFTKEEVYKFVTAVNAAGETLRLSDSQLERAFDRLWPDLEKQIKDVLSISTAEAAPPKRSIEEMVEEALAAVRKLTERHEMPEGVHHWVVICDSILDYTKRSILISKNAEQQGQLDQLELGLDFFRNSVNLILPKIKTANAYPRLSKSANEVSAKLIERITHLKVVLDDDIPF